jgi:hypothetical protein
LAFQLLLTFQHPRPTYAQEAQGFGELRVSASAGVEGVPIQVVERVRPSFEQRFSERLKLTATVEAGLAQGRNTQDAFESIVENSELWPSLQAEGYAFSHPNNPTLDISSATDYLSVERLYLDAYLPGLDLRVGRQALNWGSALLVNPTDPFPQVLLTQPWKPRAGVNALRVTIPAGEYLQAQAVLASNDTFTTGRAAGRLTVTAGQTDLSGVAAWRGDSDTALLGLDAKGTLGVGYWLEAALHLHPGTADAPGLEGAVGLDYSFPVLQSLIVAAQYYHNGLDSSNTGGLSGLTGPGCATCAPLLPPAGDPDPFAPVFHSEHYGMLSVSLGISRELSLSGLWIQNLEDGSGLVVPVVSFSPGDRFQLAASSQLPFLLWGTGGELRPDVSTLVLPVSTGQTTGTIDLSGLVPSAVISVWSRAYF